MENLNSAAQGPGGGSGRVAGGVGDDDLDAGVDRRGGRYGMEGRMWADVQYCIADGCVNSLS